MFRKYKKALVIWRAWVCLSLFLIMCFIAFFFYPQFLCVHGFYPDQKTSRVLLYAAMPVITWVNQEEKHFPGPLTAFLWKMTAPIKMDVRRPVSILSLELPFLTLSEAYAKPGAVESPLQTSIVDSPGEKTETHLSEVKENFGEESFVIIYHTHTGETYRFTDGIDRLEGKQGGVVQAGSAVKDILALKYGIKAVQSTKIHDLQYASSYEESEKTLHALLAEHQKAAVVLDIHRDAGRARKESLVKIDGLEVAPILLIVGSGARLPFPGQSENLKFADALAARLNKKYPGLCLGVRINDGRYNQYLHPRSVLVEMGSVSNSTQEAVRGARLFADVLGEMVMEMIEAGE